MNYHLSNSKFGKIFVKLFFTFLLVFSYTLSFDLYIYAHKGGTPLNGTRIRILDNKGSTYSSDTTYSNGKVTMAVPENESYSVIFETYSRNNRIYMGPQSGSKSLDVDVDAKGMY
ncbi:MAG: hypothetical protein LBF22_02045 [Deltaproteobacteria bacterium]|jgi:uncharacterized protein YfaS (alpha-2-macroglobulin family)|nr:hypothetical protein [Deltaproteobacteria bacterium]